MHQHFILGQCVFNATPPYLCCHTSLSSSFMTCSAIYIIFIHDVLNLLFIIVHHHYHFHVKCHHMRASALYIGAMCISLLSYILFKAPSLSSSFMTCSAFYIIIIHGMLSSFMIIITFISSVIICISTLSTSGGRTKSSLSSLQSPVSAGTPKPSNGWHSFKAR